MQAYTEKIIVDSSVRRLCSRAYPNHSKGCPNFGKRASCPPQCKLLEDEFDLKQGFWVVWVNFDFETHRNKMLQKHPNWSQRQIDCCLYWQGKVKSQLKKEVQTLLFFLTGNNWRLVNGLCPEAMGINITGTMELIGVKLEWPPKQIVRKVALIGVVK